MHSQRTIAILESESHVEGDEPTTYISYAFRLSRAGPKGYLISEPFLGGERSGVTSLSAHHTVLTLES